MGRDKGAILSLERLKIVGSEEEFQTNVYGLSNVQFNSSAHDKKVKRSEI